MKYSFINRQFDADPENKPGGFTPEEKSELAKGLNEVKSKIESKVREDIEKELKAHAETINESIKKFGDKLTEKDEADLKNQKALDEMLTKFKDMQAKATSNVEAKSFQVALAEALQDKEHRDGIASVSKGNRYKIELKGVIDMSAPSQNIRTKDAGVMTTSASLTGDGVVTYNSRQSILPAQSLNARDIVPTVSSATGTYVTYKETAGEGAIARQTEGSGKGQIDFDLTEVKTVTEYIAGYTRFSKQLTKHLPFLQNTLPRFLQREFFKVENLRFYTVMDTADSGSSATAETDDVKQVMDWLTTLFDTDYQASLGLLRYTALNRLNKLLYGNGYYQGSGGVLSQADGSIRIMGVPIVPVTWIPSYDKFLTYDANYVERVEVEGLSIEFFQEDSDNVQKNLVTARIECMEDFNAMRPESIIIGDFGNSSTS